MATQPALRSVRPAVRELEKVFELALDLFPERYEGNPLREEMARSRPVILIQSAGRKSALGWHWKDQWEEERPLDEKVRFSEIVLTAEWLNRPVEEVVETMIHEMVHHGNAVAGIKDCSSNQYHNKKFKRLAEEVGLVVEKMNNRGFARTELGDDLKKKVKSWGIDGAAFKIQRRQKKKSKGGGGSKLKKWTCDCGYGIRIAVSPDQVDLSCGICGGRVLPA